MKHADRSVVFLVSSQRECDVRGLWALQGRTEIPVGTFGGKKNGKENPLLNPG
jgi:hypothetical protein